MTYRFADCLLDTDAMTLTRDGAQIPVEPQVFDLIRLLAENAGRVVTRDEIVAAVWCGRIVSESTISARIASARKAVGDDGKRQAVIRTVARRGLQLVAEATSAPEPAAPVQTDNLVLDPPRIRYARNATNQSIAFALCGEGSPVLNVSFFSRAIEQEWQVPTRVAVFGPIAARHRLICYDEIGSGLSDRDMTGVSITSKADDIRAVLDAAGISSVALFAESSGGLPALEFAATHPDRVRCLVTSGCYAEGRLRRTPGETDDFVRTLISQGWGSEHNSYARAYLTAYCPDGPYEAANAVSEMMHANTTRDQMLAQRDIQNSASVLHLLDQIRCPTLVIHARHDSVHPLSEAQKIARTIPGAELHVLESGNHLPLAGSELLPPYVDTILSFLSTHGGTP